MPAPYFTEPAHDVGPITNVSGNGVRDTAISTAEGRMKIDMADSIFILDHRVGPFTTLLTSRGKTIDGKTLKGTATRQRIVGNPVFSELEDQLGGTEARVSGGGYAASGALTITVTGAGTTPGNIYTVGDIVLNTRTGERMKVATTTTTQITIASGGRAYGTSPAAAGLDGDTLLILGDSNEQFGFARNINNTRSTKIDNYVQTLKTSVGVSGQEKASDLYGGADLPYQRGKAAILHHRKVERTAFFGEKKATTGLQGHPEYATGGIEEGIVGQGAYIQNQNGQPLTPADVKVFMMESFITGSNVKTLFAGAYMLASLQGPSLGSVTTYVGDSTYGVKINKWIGAFGDINIVQNPEFRGVHSNYGFLLDMDCFRTVTMPGRDVRLEMNVQANDADGEVDQYMQDFGLERVGMARCSLMKA